MNYVCQQRNIFKQWSGEFVLAWDCLGLIHHFVIKNSLPRVNSSYIWVLENSQDKNLILWENEKVINESSLFSLSCTEVIYMRLTTICNSLEDDQVLCVAGV